MAFLKFLINVRPQNPASVLDISQLRRHFQKAMDKLIQNVGYLCDNFDRGRRVTSRLRGLREQQVKVGNRYRETRAELEEIMAEIKETQDIFEKYNAEGNFYKGKRNKNSSMAKREKLEMSTTLKMKNVLRSKS